MAPFHLLAKAEDNEKVSYLLVRLSERTTTTTTTTASLSFQKHKSTAWQRQHLRQRPWEAAGAAWGVPACTSRLT